MAKKKRTIYKIGQAQKVPAEYIGVEDVRLEFSDNFTIQHDPDGFFLTFFQVQHPIAINPEEVARIKKIQVKCVSRIFVTPSGLDSMIEALYTNRKNFQSKFTIEEVEVEDGSDIGTSQEMPITQGEEGTKEE